MTYDSSGPIVVGIDGSDASHQAACWALAEASARDVPLRLVHTVTTVHTLGEPELHGAAADEGRALLQAASKALADEGTPVKIETELRWGPAFNVLVAESRHAAMICLGTVGIGAIARAILGSTAAAVANNAHCSVAVVRPRDGVHEVPQNWVAVGVDNRKDTSIAVKAALDEARIRSAQLVVVALGCNTFGVNSSMDTERRMTLWQQSYPDVPIDVLEAPSDLADFLATNRDDLDRRFRTDRSAAPDNGFAPLAVLAAHDAHEMPSIIGPHDHPLRGHAYCSVLVAR